MYKCIYFKFIAQSAVRSAGDRMEELRDSIVRLVIETIPDINQAKATNLAEYLLSEDIGVRSMERLFNVSLENIKKHVSECDADILYRSWQQNFRKYSMYCSNQKHVLHGLIN